MAQPWGEGPPYLPVNPTLGRRASSPTCGTALGRGGPPHILVACPWEEGLLTYLRHSPREEGLITYLWHSLGEKRDSSPSCGTALERGGPPHLPAVQPWGGGASSPTCGTALGRSGTTRRASVAHSSWLGRLPHNLK